MRIMVKEVILKMFYLRWDVIRVSCNFWDLKATIIEPPVKPKNLFMKLPLLILIMFIASMEVTQAQSPKEIKWGTVIDALKINFNDWYESDNVSTHQEMKRYISLIEVDGEPVVRVENPDGKQRSAQTPDIVLNQTRPIPIKISGDIRMDVPAGFDNNSLVTFDLALFYQDGTMDYMVIPPLTKADAGKWVHRELVVNPLKPVKAVHHLSLNYSTKTVVLYRNLQIAVQKNDDNLAFKKTAILNSASSSLKLGTRDGIISIAGFESANNNAELRLQGTNSNLWTIKLKNLSSKKTIFVSGGGVSSLKAAPNRLEMFWNNIEVGGMKNVLSVKATVDKVSNEDMFLWNIEVKVSEATPFALWEIEYPVIKDIVYKTEPAKSFLFYPQDTGRVQIAPQVNISGKRMTYGTWYMSMQFLYLYGERNGFYFQTVDGKSYRKDVQIERSLEGNKFSISVIHFPENMGSAKSYVSPYATQTGFLNGDWFDAARYYRKWAWQQAWCQIPKLETLAKGAPPLSEPGLWLTNGPDGPSGKVYTPKLLKIIKETSKTGNLDIFHKMSQAELAELMYVDQELLTKTLLDMRTYFDVPIYNYIGTFVQPFGLGIPFDSLTIPGLSDVMKKLRPQGIYYIPWMSSRLFDKAIVRWKNDNAEKFAVVDDSNHAVYASSSSTMCGAMDMASNYWPKALTETSLRLMKEGYTGIYYDELASTGGEMCFSTSHGHLPGGGAYPIQARQKFLKNLKKSLSPDYPYFFTMGEEMCESYVGLCDVSWLFGSRAEDNVPAFQVIYHELSYMMGVTSEKFYDPWLANQYLDPSAKTDMEIAKIYVVKNLVAGLGLGVVRGDIMTYSPAFAAYLKKLLNAGKVGKKYLLYGELLRSPKFADSLPKYSAWWDKLQRVELPVIMSSLWRASDGKIGLALANLSDQTQIAEPVVDFSNLELAGKKLQAVDLDSQRKVFQGVAGKDQLRIVLKGNEVRIIEFSPDDDIVTMKGDILPAYTLHIDHNFHGKSLGNSGELVFYLHNYSDKELPVTIQVNGSNNQSFALKAKEIKVVKTNLTLPGTGNKIQQLTANAEVAGTTTTQEFYFIAKDPVNKVELKKYLVSAVNANSITVDGNLNDWPADINKIIEFTHYSADNKRTNDKHTTSAALAWSAEGLYFYCKVLDKNHSDPAEGENFWRGDCMQLSFNVFMTDQDKYQLIRLGLGQIHGDAKVISWDGNQYANASKLAVKRDGDYTIYEAFFPKYMLWGMTKNKKIRFSFTINENDGKSFTGWEEWTPGIMYSEKTENFGELILQ